jgi:DNA-binding MarR family transcriptional regulator
MPTQEGIGYLLTRASRGITARMSDQLRPLGLDHDMWMMIQGIRRSAESGASPDEVAERLRASKGAMMAAAERLARDGWLQPAPGQDAKAGRLVIAAKGNRALSAVDDAAHWLVEGATSGFTHEELDQLAEFLKRIIGNLA